MSGKNGMDLTITTPRFREGATIPAKYTCDGDDASPELNWSHVPEGTRSLALIMDDPDAPGGTFTHWILFDIPTSTRQLPEGVTGIGVAGRNDFEVVGYGGPCPPPNHGEHRYFFTLYALSVESLGLSEGAERNEVEGAMQGKVLDQTQLMGRYQRR